MKTTPIAKPSLSHRAAEPTPVLQTQDGMPGATVLPPSRRQAHCASMQLLADRSRRQQGLVQCVQSANASTAQRRPSKRRMQPEAAAKLAELMQAVEAAASLEQGEGMADACARVQDWLGVRLKKLPSADDFIGCESTANLVVGALTGSSVLVGEFRKGFEDIDLAAETKRFAKGIHLVRSEQETGHDADHQFVVVARDEETFDLYESNAYETDKLNKVSFLPDMNQPKFSTGKSSQSLKRTQHSHTKVGMRTDDLQEKLCAIHASIKDKPGFKRWERYHMPPDERGSKCLVQ